MKRFLIKIVVFTVVIYGLAWGLDYILCIGQRQEAGYPFQPWTEMKNHTFECDGVIMGSSRGLEHYNPYIIDSITGHNFYNLGMGGYPINIELMKYRYYCRYNPKPKYIIYDIDYIVMVMGEAKHNHQSEQYLSLVYDKDMPTELRKIGYSALDVYLPLVRWWGYQTHIKRALFEFFKLSHHVEYASYKGFTPDPDPWSPERLHFTDSVPGEMSEDAKLLLETTLYEWKKEGIQVIFANSPKYYPFYLMNQRRVEDKLYFDSLAHSLEIPYLDFCEDYWMCTDSTFFNAGVHLTPKGTDVFSAEFAEKITTLLK